MFLHTVLTGLLNDNVKRDLQPYLEQTDIADELLLERMNTACAFETESQHKRKTLGQRLANINSTQSSNAPVEVKEKNSVKQNTKTSPNVLSQLEEIRSEMAMFKELKAEVSQIRESMQQPQYTPRQRPPAGRANVTTVPQFSGQHVQDQAQGY
jgi:hypothetical protein